MPAQNRRRKKPRYRIKPLPVLLAVIALVALIALIVHFASGTKPIEGNSSLPESVPSSDVSGSSEALSSEVPSSDVSGASDASSVESGASSGESSAEQTGAETVSSGAASAASSAPVTSAPPPATPNTANIPDPPVNMNDGTVVYNGVSYAVAELPEGSAKDWNLILLNPEDENKIDQEIDFTRSEFDGQVCDARAADAFQSMKDAAKAEADVTLFLRSGYRSMSTQRVNYDAAVQRYKDQGCSDEEALRRTNQYYTVPGHSEHHSGLAFDTITPEYHKDVWSLDDRFADTAAYTWLKENCWSYGFVLRYAQDKEDITQINFEPWHYRYVGAVHARYMRDHNLCLEEYVAILKAAGK